MGAFIACFLHSAIVPDFVEDIEPSAWRLMKLDRKRMEAFVWSDKWCLGDIVGFRPSGHDHVYNGNGKARRQVLLYRITLIERFETFDGLIAAYHSRGLLGELLPGHSKSLTEDVYRDIYGDRDITDLDHNGVPRGAVAVWFTQV
jgi:hypothetical protein